MEKLPIFLTCLGSKLRSDVCVPRGALNCRFDGKDASVVRMVNN
jgi:hypothetical protein